MNLDDLKKNWQKYDVKLAAQHVLQEKLVRNIIKEKSHSVLDQMRREYILTFLYLLAFTAFCILSVVQNAFDYTYILYYTPLLLYILASLFILLLLVKGFKITRMEIDKENLLGSIRKVLHLHKEFMSRTGKAKLVFVVSGFLFPLTFFSRIYADKGFWAAGGLVLCTIGVIAVILLLARKIGLFRDRFSEKLENTLKELEEYQEADGI